MRACLLALSAALSLAACGASSGGVDEDVTLRQTMVDMIGPASDTVQSIVFELYDDEGRLAPQRLSSAQWEDLEQAGRTIEKAALHIARTDDLTIAAEGATLQNEDTDQGVSAADVAAYLKANPKGFAEEATRLASTGQAVAWFAETRDATELDRSAAALSDTCTSCHQKNWYPDQAQ